MKPQRPAWIAQIPAKVFPRGPRALYCYLCAFKSGTCFLFNYRLAAKFHVSIRTIRRWRSWLVKHKLIHTWYFDSKHPRINCHHYPTLINWMAAMATPKKTRGVPPARLTAAQRQAKIQSNRRALLAMSGRTTMSP